MQLRNHTKDPLALTDELLATIFKELNVDADTVIVDLIDIDNTSSCPGIAEEKADGFTYIDSVKHFISPIMLVAIDRNKHLAKQFGATYAGFCLESHRGLNFEFVMSGDKENGSAGQPISRAKIISSKCKQSENFIFVFKKSVMKNFHEINPDDFLTINVVDNLSKLSNTPCLGVGTVDDLIEGRKFGEGFEVCKPWYKDLIASKQFDAKGIPQYTMPLHAPYKFNLFRDLTTKNDLHRLAEEMLQKKFPGKKILAIFHDDLDDICKNTLEFKPQSEFGIVIVNHDAFTQRKLLFYGYTAAFTLRPQLTTTARTLSALGVAELSPAPVESKAVVNNVAEETLAPPTFDILPDVLAKGP